MTLPVLPPTSEPINTKTGEISTSWAAFFDSLIQGDSGTSWTPTFTGLTEVGTATKTGVYYRIGIRLCFFRIVITPGTNTSATAGTTYCNNFPLSIRQAGTSFTCIGPTAGTAGVTSSDKRIYTPSWSTITTPVTITGTLEV